ncbi:MAG: NAD+ synthase [Anaerolineae bacterium]
MDILSQLGINTDLTTHLLTDFIREEVTRTGMRRAVVGLSGGVDSALVAVLATRALGAENVLGILMPYKTSNPNSRGDAETLVQHLGIPSQVIEITPMVDPYLDAYVGDNPRRRGNIMARERMIILYDQSEAFGALVVGTSNKTENLLGYTTQYGDNAAAIHPLGDLYKTQVWQLSETLGVPEAIIKKAPSADLWLGQTDEGELGFTYAMADQILYLLVDERRRPEDIAALGFDAQIVREIGRRIQRNQFKRVTPPIAKLSARTIGADFLYSRDWGT